MTDAGAPQTGPPQTGPPQAGAPGTGVIIVGAGFAGLAMAIALKRAGRDDFVLCEQADDLGGTWRDNIYPGCHCDVPSHLYSFSFAGNPDWSRAFAGQAEILGYLRDCARRFDVQRHIRYRWRVAAATWAGDRWQVTSSDGATLSAPALVLGTGALHEPAMPRLPGLVQFAGPAFHTARWRHDVELTGRRVAVIGTGASAVQVIPELAGTVATLDVYQRTPGWVVPRRDRPIGERRRKLFQRVPLARRAYRTMLYWRAEAQALAFTVSPSLMRLAAKVATAHLHRQVSDPELRAQLTPDYRMGCKRVLLTDDYYPALTRSNVTLVTEPITAVDAAGITTADGLHRPADVLILGTGFEVSASLARLPVTGPDGQNLSAALASGERAYYGITVAGFPNLFLMTGPNTGLGHNSLIVMIEAQVAHALAGLRRIAAGHTVSVNPDVARAHNRRLQRRMRRTVWVTGGCDSWYLDRSGRNRTLWPGFSATYRLLAARPHQRAYLR